MTSASTLLRLIQKIQIGKVGLQRNMLFSLGQAVISALCVFLTFRVVIAGTSLREFGVVSVLLAIGAASKIGDVSGATALSRLLPAEIKEGRESNAKNLIKTVITTNITLFMVVAGALLFFADIFLPLIFENQDLEIAQSLLPFLVLQIIFSSLSAALASGIDGVHRADMRSLLVSAGYITLPISSSLLIPSIGVSGYVIALLVQHVLVTLIGWMLLRRFVNGLGLSPFGWDKATFMRTIGYVLRLNVMTLFAFSFEPIAKISIQITAGSSAVGLYEVASRAVFQVRNLIVSASTPTIPKLASYKANETDQIALMVKNLVPLYSWVAVTIAIALAALTPIVSYLVFAEMNRNFITVMLVLALGWSMSVIVLPIYFLAQAQGILRWNIIGHATSVVILVLGVAFAAPNGPSQHIVLIVCAAVTFSSFVYLVGNYHQFRLYTVHDTLIRHMAGAVSAILCILGISLAVTVGLWR